MNTPGCILLLRWTGRLGTTVGSVPITALEKLSEILGVVGFRPPGFQVRSKTHSTRRQGQLRESGWGKPALGLYRGWAHASRKSTYRHRHVERIECSRPLRASSLSGSHRVSFGWVMLPARVQEMTTNDHIIECRSRSGSCLANTQLRWGNSVSSCGTRATARKPKGNDGRGQAGSGTDRQG